MGAFFAGLHLRHGVDLRLGHDVAGFRGTGHVERVFGPMTAARSRPTR